jgi:outer membrane lipoprotein-sorting protein
MRRRVGAALIAVVIAGCAAREPIRPAAPSAAPLPRGEDLLGSLSARRASIRGLRAMARMAYTAEGESRSTRQLMIAERPDRLRLEVLSPFGTVFVLTTGSGRLAAYVPDERTMYRGSASADNLARYTQIDLPASDAVDLLLGTPPLAGDRASVVSEEDGLLKLWQDAGGKVYVTWFTDRLEPARYEQRDSEGRVLLRARYGAFTDVAATRLPSELEVELPSSQQRINISYRQSEANPPLADTTFALITPPGSREIALDRAEQ